jgi:hypothetical protein
MKNKTFAVKPSLMWNETDAEWDERPRNIEEQVELRRTRKRLEDCELPEGFRLVTPKPKQFWMSSQVRWGFCVAWAKVDGQGLRGADEYFYVARYEPGVTDEVQMRWALDDFSRELDVAGRKVHGAGQAKGDKRVDLMFSMRVA